MGEGSTSARPVLVLGGTSLIGRFVLKRITEAGERALAVSRSPRNGAPGVSWLEVDLAADGLELPFSREVLSLSPIWLLPKVLPALEHAGVRRLVAFSSTSRFTKAESTEAEERAVAERLADGEAEVARFCDAAGIAWTILRPTLIYAEGLDGNVSRLARIIDRFGVFPLAGEGAGLRQPVHADDLAAVALDALRRKQAAGRSYDLPGGETLTYRAMLVRIFHGLGRRPRIVSLPPPLWTLGLRVVGSRLPGVNASMGARMDADLTFDPGPAVRDLDWSPRPFRPRFRGI